MLITLPGSPWEVVSHSAAILLWPVVTIISLMLISLVAQRVGLFDWLLQRILRRARGDGRRLFFWLFWVGALTGSLLTNDAAVLILTPLVCVMCQQLRGLSPLPFVFAVLNVANLVGAFVISNPINIVVAHYFQIDFLTYAAWMLLPALVAAASTYLVLRVYFRREIAASRFDFGEAESAARPASPVLTGCAGLIGLTALAAFLGPLAGLPLWSVVATGAAALLLFGRVTAGVDPVGVVRGVAWDVLVFVAGFFIIVNGLRATGMSDEIGALIRHLAGEQPGPLIMATGLITAASSALMNNHPTAYLMAVTIGDLGAPPAMQQALAFAQLIGGDLGPKLLPIGSLAALLWFRILRDHGIVVPYALYVKIGVPVTLVALLLALAVLVAEVFLAAAITA
jgi:arsenical pump membrane protein